MKLAYPARRQAGVSLIAVALLAMGVAALAMLGLFYFRYQSLPWQDNWGYWLKAGQTKSAPAPGVAAQAPVNSALRPAATVKEGIKRCQIDGKTVYSDTLCQSKSASVQLQDNVGPAVRAPAPAADSASASAVNARLNPD